MLGGMIHVLSEHLHMIGINDGLAGYALMQA